MPQCGRDPRSDLSAFFTPSSLKRDALTLSSASVHCSRLLLTPDCKPLRRREKKNANFISLADDHLTVAGFDSFQLLLLVFMTAAFASQPL